MGSTSGAAFSTCGRYRYSLWRKWSDGRVCNFIMLNPSTADEVKNDPTVERCERRARSMGFGTLVVTNIFALRSTDPRGLLTCDDPIGPYNDSSIAFLARQADMVVAGWGNHGTLLSRSRNVLGMLLDLPVMCLGLTKTGEPRHPLYVPYSVVPKPIKAIKEAGGLK